MRYLALLLLLTACGSPRSRPSGAPRPPGSGRADTGVAPDAARGGSDAGPLADGGRVQDAGGLTDAGSPDSGPPPDSGSPPDAGGPGGPTGLEAFCTRYFECGGGWYSDVDDCMKQSLAFWGTCQARIDALDTFSDCMAAIPCSDYDPDAYDPNQTDCAPEWQALQATSC